jgi:hypothetical protein
VNNLGKTLDIRSLTPTVCRLMDIEPPHSSITNTQENLIAAMKRDGITKVAKCLVYAPDAIGLTIHEKYPEYFSALNRIINHTEPLQSMYPSNTPVCFAWMFSGASPDIHGIQKYERPVLKIDTIFDAMLRAGKKVAIIAVKNCSIDLIFRERNLDYYSELNDEAVLKQVHQNLDRYDFIVAYNSEYDDRLHKTHPYSEACMQALAHHNQAYIDLLQKIQQAWRGNSWLLVYAPDHGAHFNEVDGVGTHGQNIPEDMNLLHHYTYSSNSRQ